MKTLAAIIGACGVAAVFLAIAVAELLIRLAPLLILLAIGWAVFKVVRAQRHRDADSARLQAQWLQTPQAVIPAPAVTPSLPPLTPHYERVYLVAGEDSGFGAGRSDGDLNVAAPALPPGRPAEAPAAPLPSLAARRAARRRPTRRSDRP
ncbi:MAG: hypothetical protein QOC62_2870 [Mycobacterium sp.]|nr:hypothetical protein [Mycobacterium sp.]